MCGCLGLSLGMGCSNNSRIFIVHNYIDHRLLSFSVSLNVHVDCGRCINFVSHAVNTDLVK